MGPPNQSLGPTTTNSINRGLAAMPAQERSMAIEERALGGEPTSAPAPRGNGKEYFAQGVESACRGPHLAVGRCGRLGSGVTTRRRAIGQSGCCPAPVPDSPSRRQVCGAAALADRRTLGQAPGDRDRRTGGDLHRLFRRAVVAARRGPDQSRHRDALAGSRDRGQYRPRQYGRGRRYADRAGRADSHRRAHPRHRRARPRPGHRRHRTEGRGETLRHGAV